MAITLPEALYLLKALRIENVRVEDLIQIFIQPTEPPKEELPELPELPEPPRPPEQTTYKTYQEAKAAAKKGQTPAKTETGEWVVL